MIKVKTALDRDTAAEVDMTVVVTDINAENPAIQTATGIYKDSGLIFMSNDVRLSIQHVLLMYHTQSLILLKKKLYQYHQITP